MKLQYMGTAAAEAVPGIFCQCPMCKYARRVKGREYRGRSGAIIDDRLMIDFAPDAYSTALRIGADLSAVTDVIFTHSHNDHCCISELENRHQPVFAWREVPEEPLRLYGNHEVQNKIESALGHLFSKSHSLVYTYLEPFQTVKIAGFDITPLLAHHAVPEKAYIYLISKDGKTILWGHDTGWMPDATFDYLANGVRLDFVSLDCNAGFEPSGGSCHMCLAEDARVKAKFLEIGCADENTVWVCNHFSHNGLIHHEDNRPGTCEELEAAANAIGFTASYDGRIFQI